MAYVIGLFNNENKLFPLKTLALILCLHFCNVSAQIIRSLTRPALIQTNGLGGVRPTSSDFSAFPLDFVSQNSAGQGLVGQSLPNQAILNSNAARFPAMGSGSGAATLVQYNRPASRSTSYSEIYTAIGIDKLDRDSQVRLTITERFGNPRFASYDAPTDWYVQGTFLNTMLNDRAGNYYVVLTSGGRTADGCDGNTLGPVVGSSVYSSNSVPSGMLPNHLTMGSSGPTVYASTLEGISRRQLVGGAIAACERISNDGLCSGKIPFCATISKDLFQAMEVPVEHQIQMADPTPNIVPFDAVSGLNADSALPGIGDIIGSNLGSSNSGGLGLAIATGTAFSNTDKPLPREEETPKAIGLFA